MSAPRTPSYRLHRPSGQAVVTLNGTDHYLGKYGTPSSREAYDRKIAEWLSNGRAPAGDTETLSIAELMVRYVRFAESYYRKNGEPTSEVAILKLALRPLKRLYGETPGRDFGPLALKTVRQAFIDDGLCRNEVNRRTSHVIRLFRWLVENELVPPSVHHGLKAVPGLRKGRADVRESEPVRPVPMAFVEAVLPLVNRHVRAMIQLQLLTGCRPGEVLIMRTRDLDTAGDTWTYTPSSHKTEHHDRPRAIFLGPRAQAVVKPWLRTDLEAYLFQPAEAEAERLAEMRAARKTPVQPSQVLRGKQAKGRRFHPCFDVAAYRRVIQRACRRAGVPDWSPNQLRHTAATALRREYGLDVARVILGHSTPATTEVYAEVDQAKARDAMKLFG